MKGRLAKKYANTLSVQLAELLQDWFGSERYRIEILLDVETKVIIWNIITLLPAALPRIYS